MSVVSRKFKQFIKGMIISCQKMKGFNKQGKLNKKEGRRKQELNICRVTTNKVSGEHDYPERGS